MNTSPNQLLSLLAKFVAVVVVSSGVGLGLGLVLSELSGTSAEGTAPELSAGAAAPATAAVTGTSGTEAESEAVSGKTFQVADDVTLEVLSATFVPATSASGQARQRARVAVRVRINNGTSGPITPKPSGALGQLRLRNGEDRVAADRNATAAAGALLKPIAAGKSATGELRFETAGALTARLADAESVRLRLGGRTISVGLKR